MLISIVAGDLQNNLACVRSCHRHLSSMCDIGVVCIAKMIRRSARIAARSLPYEASITNAAGSVDDSTSSDEDEQDSVIQFDSFAFATMPRRNPYSGFVPPRTLSSQAGICFYVAVVPSWAHGGRQRSGLAVSETLLVKFKEEHVHLTAAQGYGRDHLLETDFYWLASDFTARLAKVRRRGDANESLAVTCYTSDCVKKHLLVHRVLGFTFKCPPDVWKHCAFWSQVSADSLTARSIGYEVHHINHNHGCNLLVNLRVLTVREHQRITADHRRAMVERGGT